MAIDPRELFKPRLAAEAEAAAAPLGGTRAQRLQRLQVGLFGLGAMVLLVALADVVISRARLTEATSVAEPSPPTSPSQAPRDPLADAGVVPELSEPQETGDGAPPAP